MSHKQHEACYPFPKPCFGWGQVTVHLRMHDEAGEVVAATECYECKPAPVPKSYPVCTIRNTPDKPIHCIVWAKDLLFARLFGRCGSAAHPWLQPPHGP